MVAGLEERRDAKDDTALHGKKRNDDLCDQAGVTVRGFFEDDDGATDALESLRLGERASRGGEEGRGKWGRSRGIKRCACVSVFRVCGGGGGSMLCELRLL